ncbi:enoyl-CoA hydratase/isomerase family protein [Frankia nepalensis]|uniref:enoyl-CoA hydratase/isomerase family protein n=1 Tax=Frankia nepalensis TaxID=1836974 RepID=UPI0019344467|nr:enoyl-CoA hydratase-related protein [Frankia nepalensis]
MIKTDHLIYEKDGPIATVTLNRPEVRNAISVEMGAALNEATEDFEDDPTLRVLILTGAGDKAFCAGADLKSAIPAVTASASSASSAGPDGPTGADPIKRPFSDTTKPVIAAVNGYAVAGGMEILLGTDIRIAATHASFGLPEPALGLVPFYGSHVRLPQQVSWARAMEILLVGDRISAQEALEIGLINRVVPAADLMSTARAFAERISRNSPLAVRKIKETVRAAYNRPWDEAFAIESRIAAEVLASEDAKEGPRAFAEKRQPVFQGR